MKSAEKSITSFSFTQAHNPNLSTSQVDGVIDETDKTITLGVNGTALPNLIATFSMSAGAKLEVAGTLQESGVTSNNFSSPVTYTVTAEDGSKETYVVSVQSTSKSITSFFFTQAHNPNLSTSQIDGVIDEAAKTILIQVKSNALPNLIAAFSMSAGAKLEVAGTLQKSGVTVNDFSSPVTYTVTAEDGSTVDYRVRVISDKSIISFSFTQAHNPNLSTSQFDGVIDETDKTISVQVNGSALPSLIATFSMSVGAKAEVAGVRQESGVTVNDFSSSVTYTVIAEDRSTVNYVVSVTPFTATIPGSPSTPAGITSASATGGTVTITWEAPADLGIGNDGKSTITKYKLYYSKTPGFDLTDAGIPSTEITDAALREYEVSGLAETTEYYFKLTAFNSIGEGPPAIEFSAFTPTSGLVLTRINNDTEYSVDKGTVSDTATTIVVPTYYDGKEVSTLGTNAFKDFADLVSIQLPDKLKTIGNFAFEGCSSLALTSLPNGVTAIGLDAFRGCSSLALTSLPDGLTTIRNFAFEGCSSLALTSLPDGLTSIGNFAFSGCSSLALTSLPDGITAIGNFAFRGCSSLALTSLPDGITSIGNSAFSGCSSLTLTSLPIGITSIGSYAFEGCSSLALTSLPDGLTSIASYAFSGCSSLALTSLPDGITSIGSYAFKNCSSLALTSLPDGITSIGNSAFEGCSSLALTSLPDKLTAIESLVFKGCSSLALTSLPDGITSIGNSAFEGCSSLALTSLPDGLTTIESLVFSGCSSLALTSLPDGLTTIEGFAFNNCSSLALTSLPDGITAIGNSAFYGCTGLTEITINRSTPPHSRY